MKKLALGMLLLIITSSAMAGNDVWQTLFREKLKEAGQGNSNAQYDIGSMYQNGRGVSPDRSEAISWYTKAAEQGNQKAANRLQLLQANEERFRKELANAENGDRESQYKLGNMYTEGVGTNIDLAKAVEAFRQSAGQGYEKAEYKLGLIYYEGNGVKASKKTAREWFLKAAEKGNPAAQYYLGKMYAAGQGVKRNYATSLEWYTKAVDGGFNQARSEMIDIAGRMKQQKQKKTVTAKKSPAPKKEKVARKSRAPASKPAAKSKAASSKTYGIEDLMVAAWSRDGEPVAYLPSAINNCRTETGRIACYSDNQTRKSGNRTIRFKTKSIMRNFSSDGSFEVTYRNLVIDSTSTAAAGKTDTSDEIGDIDASMAVHAVQTGWGLEHILECRMIEDSKVSCVKDKTHTFLLVSPRTVASGH